MTTSFINDRTQFILAYPFRDPKWAKKLGIGILVLLAQYIIPVLPMVVMYGYMARIVRHTAADGDDTLPEWTDLGGLMVEGLKVFGAMFIYGLPGAICTLAGYAMMFGFYFIPLMMFAVADLGGNDAMAGGAVALMFIGFGFGMLLMTIGIGLTVIMAIFRPAILGHVATQQRFGAAFKVSEWWNIFWVNKSGFLLAFVLVFGFFGLGYVAFFFLYSTLILCFLIPLVLLPAMIYGLVVWSAMVGRAYGTAREKLAMAAAVPAAE